jgi:hypothetical protein
VARVAIVCIVLSCYPLAFNAHRNNVTLLLPLSWQVALSEEKRDAFPETSATPLDDQVQALLLAPSLQVSPASPSSSSSRCRRFIRDWPHYLFTAVLVAVSVVIGIACPNVEVVLAYKGALGGSWIIYIFPGVVWFVLQQMRRYAPMRKEEGYNESDGIAAVSSDRELESVPLHQIWRPADVFFTYRGWLMLVLVAWGLVVLFVGTITTALGYNG